MRDRHRTIWQKWTETLQGPGPLGMDFIRSLRRDLGGSKLPTDLAWAHNAVMSYAYVLTLTARWRQKLTILDWGGGVGQFFPLSRALLPGVEIEYHVTDVPLLCRLGRELNPAVTFHEDDSWRASRYDLVFASSALQYVEDWPNTLVGLAAAAASYLLLIRLPLVLRSPSFVVLQRGYDYGFGTEFLCWYFNRSDFLDRASGAGLELVREFVMMDETPVHGAPEQATYRGFLFKTR